VKDWFSGWTGVLLIIALAVVLFVTARMGSEEVIRLIARRAVPENGVAVAIFPRRGGALFGRGRPLKPAANALPCETVPSPVTQFINVMVETYVPEMPRFRIYVPPGYVPGFAMLSASPTADPLQAGSLIASWSYLREDETSPRLNIWMMPPEHADYPTVGAHLRTKQISLHECVDSTDARSVHIALFTLRDTSGVDEFYMSGYQTLDDGIMLQAIGRSFGEADRQLQARSFRSISAPFAPLR
jgi:hypothetical protein